jgi:hypothetical protein
VRDVHHRDASRLEVADQAEQHVDLARREGGGRLVHHHHAGIERHRLRDLDHLLLRHGEVGHHRGRVHEVFDAEVVQQRRYLTMQGAFVQHAEAVGLAAQEDVLGDVAVRQQVELLVDDADARALGLERMRERHLLAEELDLALVGRVGAAQDFHERRLAGAVLADQGVDLAYLAGEVDAGEGGDGAEALDHAPHLERARAAGRGVFLAVRRAARGVGGWLGSRAGRLAERHADSDLGHGRALAATMWTRSGRLHVILS